MCGVVVVAPGRRGRRGTEMTPVSSAQEQRLSGVSTDGGWLGRDRQFPGLGSGRTISAHQGWVYRVSSAGQRNGSGAPLRGVHPLGHQAVRSVWCVGTSSGSGASRKNGDAAEWPCIGQATSIGSLICPREGDALWVAGPPSDHKAI
ncbi:MAG: hypothetical protein ACYTDW_19465 [Planctomycetota bacterium]